MTDRAAARYMVCIADRAGEREESVFADPVEALRRRDKLQRDRSRGLRAGLTELIRALDRDSIDPPQSGEIEWCDSCGATAVLASPGEWCDECERLAG